MMSQIYVSLLGAFGLEVSIDSEEDLRKRPVDKDDVDFVANLEIFSWQDNPVSQFVTSDWNRQRHLNLERSRGRWVFWQKGPTAEFEDESHYIRKPVKDRLNREVIAGYLNKLGIDLYSVTDRRELDHPVLFTGSPEAECRSPDPNMLARSVQFHSKTDSSFSHIILES